MKARPYQVKMLADIRASLSQHKHALGVLPTGGGKTFIASHAANGARQKGKRVMFTCHRDFLIEQTSEAFKEEGIPHTFIATGETYNPFAKVVIASMDMLKRRLDKIEPPDLLVVDEAVHAAAGGWAKVIEYYQAAGCYTLGLTACPQRMSGQGLGLWFRDMVLGPSTGELMEQGYLSKYKAFDHTNADLSGLHNRGGEYVMTEAADIMNKPAITGSAVREYRKIGNDRQGLMFCCSIQHSQNVAEAFRADGHNAAHIGADTNKADRKEMLADYRAGRLKILTAVDIFNEGFNVPAAGYAGLLRPTKSLSIYLQQCGRVLRAEEDKDHAIISDHANNIRFKNGALNHGFPDDDREWTLESKEKKKRGEQERMIPVRQCTQCFFAFKPAPVCPNCQYEFPVQYREVMEIEGELAEINKLQVEQAKKEARKEQGTAESLEDLIAIGRARGYGRPEFWARKVWSSRQLKSKPRRGFINEGLF